MQVPGKKKTLNSRSRGRVDDAMTAVGAEQTGKRKKKKMKKNKVKTEMTAAVAADAAEEEADYDIVKENKKDKKKKKKKPTEKGVGNDDTGNKKQEKRSSRKSGGNLITDARFSAIHSDPRFQRVPKHQSKVTIDSRFRNVFSHKDFSSTAPFDKRGQPKKIHPKDHPLRHYYRQEGDTAAEGDDGAEGASAAALSSASSSSSDSEEVSVDEGYASSSSSDDSIDEDDIEELQNSAFDVDPKNIFQEDIPTIEQETHRLAIVNLDWKFVKAVDLYVLLSSCLPKDGQILSVTIYPSEFGRKRMEEEALNGPMALFDGENKNEEEEDNDDDDYYKERLREYERSTLRYYFAVLECDSIATADYLYKTCDGIELERSSNVLDLRFIPDSMEFKHPPHDIATEAPANYQALDFHTPALQRTNIQLSWDEDEPQRKILKRKLNSEQLAEMDLKEFLASDDDRSTDNDEDDDGIEAMPDRKSQKLKKADMYRLLVQSGDGSDADEENNKDMEVTFNTGLEDISKRILEKKDKKSETVWEAYLRKRREKKKARKRGSKDLSEDDDSDDSNVEVPEGPDDFFVEESSDTDAKAVVDSGKGAHKKNDRKKHLKERKSSSEAVNEQEASRAELELLLADDQGGDHLKGYNLKSKRHKGKKGKETLDDENVPSIADDPRFSVVFTSPLFALDPTDPQFKRSAAYMRQLRQKQKGGEKERKERKDISPPKPEQFSTEDVSYKNNNSLLSNNTLLKNDKHELSSLVRRVKRRVGSLQS